MAFLEKENLIVGGEGWLIPISNTQGASRSVVETTDNLGNIINVHPFGDISAPSATYKLSVREVNETMIKLGERVGADRLYVSTSLTIDTAAGVDPSISNSAVQVESPVDTAPEGGVYVLINGLSLDGGAQLIQFKDAADAADTYAAPCSIGGDGCYLQSAGYTIGQNVNVTTKDGAPIAHVSSGGRVEVSLTIAQVGEEEPTLALGDKWEITSPLSMSNNDASEPSWSVTLMRPLKCMTRDAAASYGA